METLNLRMQDGMDACGVYQFDREAFMIFLFQDLISPRKEGVGVGGECMILDM
jgi:hypothetical protein